jgi:hypothetical protein
MSAVEALYPPWFRSPVPIRYSVSQTVFRLCFVTALLSFGPQNTTRAEIGAPAVAPNVRVDTFSYLISTLILAFICFRSLPILESESGC